MTRLDAWDGSSGLVHWEDPEGWDGEGGGRGDRDGEHTKIHGWFMSVYGKNHYNIVISLQLIKIKRKKFYFNWRIITLQYCDVFLPFINMNWPWVHTWPHILNPLLTYLPTPSLWTIPEHWFWVPCFMHWTCTGHLFYIQQCTCFKAIFYVFPPLPSPTESRSMFSTSASVLLSCI